MNCDECGSPVLLDAFHGEYVCSGCSLVLERVLDARPSVVHDGDVLSAETVSFTNTGVQSTRLTNERYDGRGNIINESTHEKFKRLAWLNSHSLRRKDRSLKRLHGLVSAACMKLEANPNLRDRAFHIAKKAYEQGALHNQEFSLLVGSAIMLALQEAGRHVSFDGVLDVLPVSRRRPKKQLARAYRVVKRTLGLVDVRGGPEMIVAKLGLSLDVLREAKSVLRSMPERQKPETDAAFAVFVAAQRTGKPIPQTAVAVMCGTSDVALRARLRKEYTQYLKAKLQIVRRA